MKLVRKIYISEAKFITQFATSLHNDCQLINIETKELHCFAFVLKNVKVYSDRWFGKQTPTTGTIESDIPIFGKRFESMR